MTVPPDLLVIQELYRHLDLTCLRRDMTALAAASFAGRRVGTAGHDQARDWLVERMQALALHPTRFPFTLATPVVDVYAPLVVTLLAGESHPLRIRREVSEHPRSAEHPQPLAGIVTRWQEAQPDWHGQWVWLESEIRGPALNHTAQRVHQGGGVGLLLPQPATAAGFLVKRPGMGEPVDLPVLTVRADLLPHLVGRQLSATVPVRPQWPTGDLVVGEIVGADATLRTAPLIIGAHYDGVGSDPGGPHFSCATDNAAGVAVMLEIARLFQQHVVTPPRRTIRFVAFDAEEINAQGSLAYAQSLSEQGEQPIVLNIDGAARWPGHLTLELGPATEELLPILDQVGRAMAIPLEQGMVSSDNRRFASAGFPSVGIMAGLAGIHTPADTVAQVEEAALQQTGAFVLALIAHLTR